MVRAGVLNHDQDEGQPIDKVNRFCMQILIMIRRRRRRKCETNGRAGWIIEKLNKIGSVSS